MMGIFKLVILSVALIGAVQCFDDSRTADSKPLYLTPYIESGQITTAKKLSLVTDNRFLGITSYAGYLTVNKKYNSNLFIWFFPAKKSSSTAPTVLWLAGGPGMSSIYDLFMQNGPFYVNSQNKLSVRQYSWNQNHNLLYIDNPVGTGFSFTNDTAGYATNETTVGNDLFAAVRQFYILFPSLRTNGLYITGQSYAGKYCTALGYKIFQKKFSADSNDRINVKGFAIGDGVIDTVNQIQYGEFLYQRGFVDEKIRDQMNAIQQSSITCIQQGDFLCAVVLMSQVINSDTSLFNTYTGFVSPHNSLYRTGYNPSVDAVTTYMQDPNIGKALHVGNNAFIYLGSANNVVLNYLIYDVMDTVAPWFQELLNYYKFFIYNGENDLLVGYVLSENFVTKLKFGAASAYQSANRTIWKVDNDVAGFVKQAGNLVRIFIRNAGHMAGIDQPAWTYDMLLRLTTGTGYS